MKIVQQLPFGIIFRTTSATSFTDMGDRFYFDPTLFSGLTGIFADFTAKLNLGTDQFEVELYDFTNNATIDTITVTGAGYQRKRGVDVKATLNDGNGRILGYRCRRVSGTSSFNIANFSIIVNQSDVAANRKTASYFLANSPFIQKTGTGWYGDAVQQFKVPVGDFNGTVEVKFEAIIHGASGGTAQARLYDVTAAAEVSGSLIETTATTRTRVLSGALTLDPSHVYQTQVQNATAGKLAQVSLSWVRVAASGFSKIVSAPLQSSPTTPPATGVWFSAYPLWLFDRDNITGDTVTFKFNWVWTLLAFDPWAFSVRLYDLTNSAAISGTEHSESGDPFGSSGSWEDTPIMPAASAEMTLQANTATAPDVFPGTLFAYQNEALPAAPSVPADPTQPSGYHCFMSQFFKNRLANYPPLKTPDGVNRCY